MAGILRRSGMSGRQWRGIMAELRARNLWEGEQQMENSKLLAWRDVPADWGKCETHKFAWWPPGAGCVYCDESLKGGIQ